MKKNKQFRSIILNKSMERLEIQVFQQVFSYGRSYNVFSKIRSPTSTSVQTIYEERKGETSLIRNIDI